MSETTEQNPKTQTGDIVLQEVWRIKDQLSASYGHDIHKLFEQARKSEKLSGHPISNLQPKRGKI